MSDDDSSIFNFTPQTLVINGRKFTPAGDARIKEINEDAGTIDNVPVVRQINVFGEHFPTFPMQDVYFIVPRAVFDAFPERKDFLTIGDTVRDSQGQIITIKNLVRR